MITSCNKKCDIFKIINYRINNNNLIPIYIIQIDFIPYLNNSLTSNEKKKILIKHKLYIYRIKQIINELPSKT